MAESRWQDIYSHLEAEGFDVYSPATKTGECITQYIVIKNDGSSKLGNFSTDNDLYALLCYVPKQKYSELEVLVQNVKEKMKKLEPMIKPIGMQTPSYYDDGVKAHMISMQYVNSKKIL